MSPTLEDDLRATLAARARDVTPDPRLADAALNRAVRLRRTRRLQIAAGAVVVVGVVAIVPVLAAFGASDDPAPPIQPGPTVSPGPVPEIVLTQAAETHALLGTPTTIVDGVGPDVLTVPVAAALVDEDLRPEIQQVFVARAKGGYVTKLLPRLFGAWTFDTAPAGVINFVRPDGSATLLGHPTPESRPIVSPDGSLVAFETAGPSGGADQLVVVDLDGRTIHQHAITGPKDGRYLTGDGLWFSCSGLDSPDADDNAPHFWDFATDAVILPSFPEPVFWVAQNDERMMVLDYGAAETVRAYDMTTPASPRLLWTAPTPTAWAFFDASGTRVLASDARDGNALSLDLDTGKVLDRTRLDIDSTMAVVSPAVGRWMVYGQRNDGRDLVVEVVTAAPNGTLTRAETSYLPYQFHDFELPGPPLIGVELAPPQP